MLAADAQYVTRAVRDDEEWAGVGKITGTLQQVYSRLEDRAAPPAHADLTRDVFGAYSIAVHVVCSVRSVPSAPAQYTRCSGQVIGKFPAASDIASAF